MTPQQAKWVAIDIEEHMWQRNLAETLANYLNDNNITIVHILEHTEKNLSAIGWQEPEGELAPNDARRLERPE